MESTCIVRNLMLTLCMCLLLQLGFLTVFISLGFMFALHCTAHTAANFGKRMGFLVSFAFFTGMSLGPLLDMAIRIEPR